jgi:uncharacterized protein YdhG (YjbR/CyaY superfamily)
MKKFISVDNYMASLSPSTRKKLQELRSIIKEAAPQAEEIISYNMPAFACHGTLVYYAACKDHIGFYPTPTPIKVFKDELSKYNTSKGAIQLLYDAPLPVRLIKQIVKLRMRENTARLKSKELKR